MDVIDKSYAAFAGRFPNSAGAVRFFRAPGRVNLIGEHTDYNDGFVLPAAIDFHTVVAAAPRADSRLEVFAADIPDDDRFDLAAPVVPHPTKHWANYIRGVAQTLLANGHSLRGLNLAITGNIPLGAGLSSSASLEVAAGLALLTMSSRPINRVALAQAGQRAENAFVGVQSGIMDQFTASLGEQDHALLIDCRNLSHTPVPIPQQTAIIVVDSGVQRGLVDSEYNARRNECRAAAARLGVPALRDLDEATFNRRAHTLPPLIRRRARHVITENARTVTAAGALESGNLNRLGPLMAQSQRSMRNEFEITVPAIDALVKIMQGIPGVYGARMTGGGFGGCCVALAPKNVAPAVKAAVDEHYHAQTGFKATVYVCRASRGAEEVLLHR
ncbi:MAG: galactokinase [Anaerolineae bacterium]